MSVFVVSFVIAYKWGGVFYCVRCVLICLFVFVTSCGTVSISLSWLLLLCFLLLPVVSFEYRCLICSNTPFGLRPSEFD